MRAFPTELSGRPPLLPIRSAVFLLLFYGLALLVVAVVVRARKRGRGLAGVVVLGTVTTAGSMLLWASLFALAFNGHVEDFGSPPARTLGIAIPALTLSALILIGAWLAASGSVSRTPK